MDKIEFFEKLKNEFIDMDSILVDENTIFRDLDSWDSLTGMSILVMVKDEYDVDINDADLRSCITFGDIFKVCNHKKNNGNIH